MKISLAAARVNAGLTLKEASESLGMNANTLSGWETGKRSPKVEDLLKYCELLGVNIGDLEL